MKFFGATFIVLALATSAIAKHYCAAVAQPAAKTIKSTIGVVLIATPIVQMTTTTFTVQDLSVAS